MKTTNISKTKPKETKAWFRLRHSTRKWIGLAPGAPHVAKHDNSRLAKTKKITWNTDNYRKQLVKFIHEKLTNRLAIIPAICEMFGQ